MDYEPTGTDYTGRRHGLFKKWRHDCGQSFSSTFQPAEPVPQLLSYQIKRKIYAWNPKEITTFAAESYLTVLHRKTLKYERLPNRYPRSLKDRLTSC